LIKDEEEKHRLENSKANLEEKIRRMERNKRENHREISDILFEAKIEEQQNLEEAMTEFRKSSNKYRRYLELKDRVIPELRNAIDADEIVMQRQEKMNKLKEEIERLERQAPELANLSADKSFSQYSEEVNEINQRLIKIERERQNLRPALNTIDNYQRDYPSKAVRLALSDYFSPVDSPLPIILDEPFATRDDSGFESGMKFILKQVSLKHQVIILTCHRQRHQWLRDNDPEWWQKFISEVRLSSP
jgi:hypothetical protein